MLLAAGAPPLVSKLTRTRLLRLKKLAMQGPERGIWRGLSCFRRWTRDGMEEENRACGQRGSGVAQSDKVVGAVRVSWAGLLLQACASSNAQCGRWRLRETAADGVSLRREESCKYRRGEE